MGVSRPKTRPIINRIPDYSVKSNAELSNSVGNGYSKANKEYTGTKNHAVSQLYNKGSYGVVGAEELKDPSLGKRRL